MMNIITAGVRNKIIIVKNEKMGDEEPHLSDSAKIFVERLQKLPVEDQLRFMFHDTFFLDLRLNYDPEVFYSKSYFAKKYYCVDPDTFNKWLMVFCKDIYDKHSSGRNRRFSKSEYEIIIKSMGLCDHKENRPYNKIEIANLSYFGEGAILPKKSAKYMLLKSELERFIPEGAKNLSKFPPAFVRSFLKKVIDEDVLGAFDSLALKRKVIFDKITEIENRTPEQKEKTTKELADYWRPIFNDLL